MELHTPVLKAEVIKYLQPAPGKKFIDATLGDGGHAIELLNAGSEVLGIDYYRGSIKRARERIKSLGLDSKFQGRRGNFKHIEKIAQEAGFGKVDGILFDLGFSSTQLEDEIGLSFQNDAPLDMRLDKDLGVTAADLLNALPESQLVRIFKEYSDEKYAKRFAGKIVEHRKLEKLQTTKQLAELLSSAAPPGYERGRIHPATRVFQALRIAVNDEIENLKFALPRAAHLLLPGGRMVIISFHSLEDKVAKNLGHSVQPDLKELTEKPIVPKEEEIERNVRSRSAKMRVYEKNE